MRVVSHEGVRGPGPPPTENASMLPHGFAMPLFAALSSRHLQGPRARPGLAGGATGYVTPRMAETARRLAAARGQDA